eukprot:7216252-Prorocentrum_lima.AAC.1
MLLLGDFWQLPPPDGGDLAAIPRDRLAPATAATEHPLVTRGRALLWDGATQGITELTEIKRCADIWWNEVVDEF